MSATTHDSAAAPGASIEQHRRECEARLVLSWPLAQRREYLKGVAEVRGDAAAEELKQEIRRQWAERRGEHDVS